VRPVRIRGYAPATPCWVELASADPAASAAFYGELLDWKLAESQRFLLRDFAVAGLRPVTPERPGGWLLHLSTDDLDVSLDRVIAAGGLLRIPPAVVGAADRPDGRTATICDPSGATLGLWERGRFGGAQLGGEPGALCWSELATADPYGAADFYARSFDWLLRGGPAAGSERGEWLTAAHDSVAGLTPGHGAAEWLITFQVEDCVRTAAACARLGGAGSDPLVTGPGTYAELVDPFGAAFRVMSVHGNWRVG
jgi:predicted enzyme related to lactoylglutathione lyase